MTKQEAINLVYKYYIIDKKPLSLFIRKTKDGTKIRCMYRHKNGSRCPGGLLLRNDEYKHGYENQNFLQIVPKRLKHIASFVLELQYIHDSTALWSTLPPRQSRDRMGRRLCALAHKHGLNYYGVT